MSMRIYTLSTPWAVAAMLLVVSLAVPATPGAAAGDEEPATDAPAADTPPVDAPGPASLTVAEAVICTEVQEHQPVNAGDRFSVREERLICWTRIVGGQGETVVHAWIHEGTTRARVELPVRGPAWRTWSSKRLLASWTGSWEVKIMTKDGAVLKTIGFEVE